MSSSSVAFVARIRQTSCRIIAACTSSSSNANLRASSTRAVCLARYSRPAAASLSQGIPSWRALSTTTTPSVDEEIIPGIGKGKTSTGYTGVPVEPDWYNVMLKKFQLLLDTLERSDMPETAQYRIDVTKWASFVIATVKANPNDPEKVESEVRMGQVEELIEMADDEMIAMKVYLKSRMWELVAQQNEEGPEIDFNPDPMHDEAGDDADPRTRKAIEDDLEAMALAGVNDGDDDEEVNDYAEYEYGTTPKFRPS